MDLKAITWDELLAKFEPDCHGDLERLRRRDIAGICVFENLDFSASAFGQRTAVAFGAGRTFRNLEQCQVGHLNDLPSQRQYATSYWPSEHCYWPKEA